MTRYCSFGLRIAAVMLLTSALGACVTSADKLADGTSVKSVVLAQTDDPAATARNGTTTPQGTDPEVAAGAVKGVRERGGGSSSKPGLLEALFGGLAGK